MKEEESQTARSEASVEPSSVTIRTDGLGHSSGAAAVANKSSSCRPSIAMFFHRRSSANSEPSVSSSCSDAEWTPRRGKHKRSMAPRMGSVARQMGDDTKVAVARANLSYDTRSWLNMLGLLDLRHSNGFILIPLVFFTCLSIALKMVDHYFPEISPSLYEVPSVAAFGVGSIMSLLLAFRLNASYTRWSVARTLWGQVINGTRSLLTQLIASGAAHQTSLSLSPEHRQLAHTLHKEVGGWCIAFAVAMCCHLRGQKLPFEPLEDEGDENSIADARARVEPRTEHKHKPSAVPMSPNIRPTDGDVAYDMGITRFVGLSNLLTRSQLAHVAQSTHPPLYALTRLRHAVEAALHTTVPKAAGSGSGDCMSSGARSSCGVRGSMSSGGEHVEYVSLYPHVGTLSRSLFYVTEGFLEALTGCERILRTPLPPGYVGVLRSLIIFFLTVLPFALLEGLSWGLIPVCTIFSYLLLYVEETAVQIEQPFGFEYNDLPIDVYCLTVQADVLRMLDESQLQAEHKFSTERRSVVDYIPRWSSQL